MEEDKIKGAKKYDKYWNIVENTLNEGTKNGYKIAVIETEKILRISLREKNIPGESPDDKINSLGKVLANPDKLKYSRAMYKKLIDESGFDISLEDTKEIIAGYYKAISDISEMNYYSVSTKDKIYLFAEKYSKKLPIVIKNVLIALLIFFAALFISSETKFGQNFSSILIEISRLIFYKLIPTVIAISVFIFILLAIFSATRKRNKY